MLPTETINPGTFTERLSGLETFLPVYGKVDPRVFADYDLLVLEGGHYLDQDINNYKREGQYIIAYLSITEINGDANYFSRLEGQLLGRHPYWNSFYLDPGNMRVREELLNIAGDYRQAGFDGLFLDTLDNTGPHGPLRAHASEMTEFVAILRKMWPEALLVQNSGLHIPPGTCDMVIKESVLGYVDFDHSVYGLRSPEIQEALVHELNTYGMPYALLEYARTKKHYKALEDRMGTLGCMGSIANLELQGLPKFEVQ